MSGNNCGHVPEKPRWFDPPTKHANRPGILRKIIEKIREYYSKPCETLPILNAVNESGHQQRSERREACVAILGCVLHYTDLITLRVGIPQADGSISGLTMPYLAKLSGLGERRAERAIRDLKAAGIITMHPVCEKLADATYKGYAAIRTVTKHLFTVFGLDAWLMHEQTKTKERRDKREEKKRRKALANMRMATNAQHGAKPKTKPEDTTGATRTNRMSSIADHIANMRNLLQGSTGPPIKT
jgi:hypothetical protein